MRRSAALCQSCRTVLLFSLLSIAGSMPLDAQNSRGTILGHVSDPSGAAVQGAKVIARNVNTSVSNRFTTSAVGDYVFVDLVPGTYEVSVSAQGFKVARSSGLILEVDQTLRQDFTLIVGAVTEEVTITDAAQMVQTDNTTTGNVLDQRMIEELPLNGRDFTNLLNLSAGAANLGQGIQSTGFVLHGLSSFTEVSLNGARPDSISYMVDGVQDNDAFFSGSSNVPSEFALQEVKVQTGLYSAEYGEGSGQVNVAVKSGSNQWHGQAYDYFQNDALQPRSPLQKTLNNLGGTDVPLRLPFKQNQFGGTLGGPVRIPWLYNGQNRSFWFFAYDGGRRSFVNGTQNAIFVPTVAERGGDFSDWPFQLYDPTTTQCNPACDPTTRQPYLNNKIPSSEINAVGQKLANLYPLPNLAPTPGCTFPCPNYVKQIHRSIDSDNETMRVDQNFGERDRIYFTGHIRHDFEPNPSQLPFTGSTSFTNGQLFGLNWEHAFSANIINEARFGYNHQFYNSNADTAYGPNIQAQLGFQNTPLLPALYGIPVINLDYHYSNIGAGSAGTTVSTKHTSFQVVDNLKLIRGKHTLTMGVDIRRLREFEQDNFLGTGSITFNGEYTANNPSGAGVPNPGPGIGNPVADLLLSDPSGMSGPALLGVDYFHVAGTNWNLFFQDDFRVTPRLTINLGLRYEIPPNYHSTDNSGWTLNPANGGSLSWVSKSFVQNVTQLAASQGLAVYPNFLNCCVPNTLVPIDKKDFAPRIGVAWRPFPTDRFVVRAGYGIFYDTYNRYYDLVQNFDENALQTLFPNPGYVSGTGVEKASPEPSLSRLWLPPVSGAQFFSTTQPWNPFAFSSPILNQVEWPFNHNPYNQQWTLDTQYALRQDLLLDVGYVGAHGVRLPTQLLYNTAFQPRVPSDNCNFLFDASQATGSNASCATDPNFQPIDKRVPLPNLPSNVYANANVLNSNYSALQVQLRQRLWRGLTYQVAYTWSRAFDETSGVNNIWGNGTFIQNPHDIQADYGPSSFDQPNRLTLSGAYEFPVGKNKRWSLGWANWILGGWKMSGIYSRTSGRTFSVYEQSGPTPDEMGAFFPGRYRADQSGNPTSTTSSFKQSPSTWFNTSVFSSAPQGAYGNEVKGNLRGPYFEDLDLSFGKWFPITERQRLQYRLEIFNVGSNWHSNGSNLIPNDGAGPNGCAAFGALGTIGCNAIPLNSKSADLNLWTPRVLQMSLVYSF